MNSDVAIVGGGMVGATLACALGQSGLRVDVVESTPASGAALPSDGFATRVSALTPASVRVLESIGAWPHVDAARVAPFREMRVWERAGQEIHFDAADIGEPALGYIVENANVVRALTLAAGAIDALRWHRPATLEALDLNGGAAAIGLTGGARIGARLVVGADGARSRVRELAGIAQSTREFRQRAVVATVRAQLGHADTAWQRFTPTGPLAFLPLPGKHCSVVWSTTPEHAQALLDEPPGGFAAALADAFDGRLGTVELIGERAAFTLTDSRAARYVAHRVALAGDAAHTVHPLAGQGANLGLLDAAALAEVVGRLSLSGRDLGLEGNLRRYERWRRGENLLAGDVLGAFHQLFGACAPPVPALRSAGLSLANRCGLFKRLVMRRAGGLDGDLPALARGVPG